MRRAPIILSTTVAGLAATVAFQPHQPGATTSSTTANTSAPASATARAGAAPDSSSTTAEKAYTGDAVPTQYGDVQVQVTVQGGKVTAVAAVALPGNDPRSQQISASVEPTLRASALQAQSASFDGVSGATYTSEGYKASLQAALDQAGLSGPATAN